MRILTYSFSGKIDTEKLQLLIVELLQLDNSKVISILTESPQDFEVSFDYKEFENGTLKSMVDLYFSKNYSSVSQLNELNFGVQLSHKLNMDLYFFAPDFSKYEVIKISPIGNVFSGTEIYFEDETGQEITLIEGLNPLEKSAIDKLQTEIIQSAEIEYEILEKSNFE